MADGELTAKQERNGITMVGTSENTAQPSADITGQVSGLSDSAQAAAGRFMGAGEGIMSGQSTYSETAAGDMWDWKDGLAVNSVNTNTTDGGGDANG